MYHRSLNEFPSSILMLLNSLMQRCWWSNRIQLVTGSLRTLWLSIKGTSSIIWRNYSTAVAFRLHAAWGFVTESGRAWCKRKIESVWGSYRGKCKIHNGNFHRDLQVYSVLDNSASLKPMLNYETTRNEVVQSLSLMRSTQKHEAMELKSKINNV